MDQDISRGFSLPVFRLDVVPDFIAALRAMGLPDWVLVREKLYTSYADHVILLLVSYKDAFVAREAAEKVWYGTQKTYPLTPEFEDMLHLVRDTKETERLAYETLCLALTQQPEFKNFEQHAHDWELVKLTC